jgi:DNA-binding NarL/FixJ family response regulator
LPEPSCDGIMIQLLLVDNQPLFRNGLAAILAGESDLVIVGQTEQGKEAIELTSQLQPNVILLEIATPVEDGIATIHDVLNRFPWIHILVLSTLDEEECIWKCLRAGVLGYLLKSTPAYQIAAAVRAVAQGYSQLGPSIAAKVFSQMMPPCLAEHGQYHSFNQRELQILSRLGQGKKNREIAQDLHLTEGTIKNHLTRILGQLGAKDRTQAALWAKQHLL